MEKNTRHGIERYPRVLAGVRAGLGVCGTGPTGGVNVLPYRQIRQILINHRRLRKGKAHSSKWVPLLGFNRLFILVFMTLRSGRTTITGTGERERQYLDTGESS